MDEKNLAEGDIVSSGTLWPTDEVRGFAMWQPWAAFVAYGIKWIETRSWSTNYRGRLKILAAKRPPFSLHRDEGGDIIGDYVLDWGLHPDLGGFTNGGFDEGCGFVLSGPDRDEDYLPMHLGCFVAECDLVDVVPIRAADEELRQAWERHVAPTNNAADELWLWEGPSEHENTSTGRPTWRHRFIEDQRPYGDFTPGRYAWLFDNVKLIDPEPAKGHQGLWRVTSQGAVLDELADLAFGPLIPE